MTSPSPPARRGALIRLLGIAAALTALGAGAGWWSTRRPPIAFTHSQCKGMVMGQSKVLVTYASRAGSTGEIGEAIMKRLCTDGFDADLREVSRVESLDSYAAIVLGSAVRYGGWLPEMLKFVQRHRDTLARRPLAYFSACSKAKDQSAASLAEMASYAKAAREIAAPATEAFFAGKIDMAKLSFFDRMMVRMIGSAEGDFRDWAAIGAWARTLVPLFQSRD